MNLLQSLAGGLRSAAGVLSPRISQDVFVADERNANMQQQMQQQLLLQQRQHELQQATPQARMQEQQLLNEKGFRQAAAQAQGDPERLATAAMEFGKPEIAMSLYKSQEDRLQRAQTAKDALDARIYDIDKRSEDRALTRGQVAELARIRDETVRRGQDLTGQIAQMTDSTKRMLGVLTAQVAEARRDTKNGMTEYQRMMLDMRENQQTDAQVTRFANFMQQQKIPGVLSSINAANEVIKKYEGKDIPGIGVVVGSEKFPDLLRSKEGNNVRSAVQGATNDLLNLYSGLAVTLPEGERRNLEQMRGGNFTVEEFKAAWPRVVSRLNDVVGNVKAGIPKKALEAYESREGALNLKPISAAFEKGSDAPSGVDPKVWDAMTPEEKKLWQK